MNDTTYTKAPTRPRAPRAETAVMADLEALCTRPGYVHAIAALCFRDNTMLFTERLTEADLHKRFNPGRLLRTEINTLLGQMLKAPIDWTVPPRELLGEYIEASDRLLAELHKALSGAVNLGDMARASERGEMQNPFESGAVLREPIFYAAESAYNFQYLDLAVRRYAADAEWLATNVGFTMDEACVVANAADALLMDQFPALVDTLRDIPVEQWSVLPAFKIDPARVAQATGLSREHVERIFLQFTVADGDRNPRFICLQEFNQIAATPLLRTPQGDFVMLQNYALAEAMYDSPFYWMNDDKPYRAQRDRHRGEFTENFVAQRLVHVFGADHVSTNVELWHGKTRVAEIDVLVRWADRAMIVQAKAKRLTVEARKGNDQMIRDDFRKSVQDAYDQGLACAEILGADGYTAALADGTAVEVSGITEIFTICVVSDHYPALSFQARQFLKTREVDRVRAALVCDVFLVDVLTEFLATPLHFLSFIARRARYGDRILAAQELTILGYHLKHNLWLEDETSILHLAEDFTAAVDVAMAVRRRGIPGDATPEGFLTRFEGKALGRLVQAIERHPDPAVLEQGFQLLEMSGDAFDDLSRIVERQARRTAQDGESHDAAVMFADGSGVTFMTSDAPADEAARRLATLCVWRKYRQKVDRWFGVCVSGGDAHLRFGLRLAEPWVQDDAMDAATAGMIEPLAPKVAFERAFRGGRSHPKVGRNEPCPCGSGRKYKRCCIP